MKKITFSLIIKILLWVLVLLCCKVILFVGLGIGEPWGTCQNYEKVNNVLLNLSYSYLAGCIFYILTVALPHWNKSRKVQVIIKEKLSRIYGKLVASQRCVLDLIDYNKPLSDDEFITILRAKGFGQPAAFSLIYDGATIGNQLHQQKEEILALIDDLMRYQDSMSLRQIQAVANLSSSTYFDLLKTVQIPLFDNDDSRKSVGEELVKELSRMREIVD